MEKIFVQTKNAPTPGGPYHQAVLVKNASNLLHISGQLGINPKTGEFVTGGFENEMRQAFANLDAILKEVNGSFENIVKVNCYLADMDNFAKFNEIFQEYFTDSKPARTTFQAGKLPKNAQIEVEAVAILPNTQSSL